MFLTPVVMLLLVAVLRFGWMKKLSKVGKLIIGFYPFSLVFFLFLVNSHCNLMS